MPLRHEDPVHLSQHLVRLLGQIEGMGQDDEIDAVRSDREGLGRCLELPDTRLGIETELVGYPAGGQQITLGGKPADLYRMVTKQAADLTFEFRGQVIQNHLSGRCRIPPPQRRSGLSGSDNPPLPICLHGRQA